jgi:plasmid stability protein
LNVTHPEYWHRCERFARKLENQKNGDMKTTLDLPDDLVKEVKLRAVHEGQKFKDAVIDLLRKGLSASDVSRTTARAEASLLQRRKEIGMKFISGQWGVELEGYEAGRAADRAAARKREARWRK